MLLFHLLIDLLLKSSGQDPYIHMTSHSFGQLILLDRKTAHNITLIFLTFRNPLTYTAAMLIFYIMYLIRFIDIDNCYLPLDIVKSIPPKENMFVFFEVSDRSFHQVNRQYFLYVDDCQVERKLFFRGEDSLHIASYM